MPSVDRQIGDAFALLGVLLVFVLAYFSALVPLANELIARPRPDVRADRDALVARVRSYRLLAAGVALFALLVLLLLVPLTRRAVIAFSTAGGFPTMKAGLFLVDALLLTLLAVTVALVVRLGRRIAQLTGAERG
jgi:hypothetical protein